MFFPAQPGVGPAGVKGVQSNIVQQWKEKTKRVGGEGKTEGGSGKGREGKDFSWRSKHPIWKSLNSWWSSGHLLVRSFQLVLFPAFLSAAPFGVLLKAGLVLAVVGAYFYAQKSKIA